MKPFAVSSRPGSGQPALKGHAVRRHGLRSSRFGWLAAACLALTAWAASEADLRLVPFPKQVRLEPGRFSLNRPLRLEAPSEVAGVVGPLLAQELRRAGLAPPAVSVAGTNTIRLRLVTAAPTEIPPLRLRDTAGDEDYGLRLGPDEVVILAPAPAGLLHGAATLGQLIRANRQDHSIPCLALEDWPALRWRAFQDDLTRGPSTKLDQLQRDAARGAWLKLNLFTYYMQHQFAFTRHPLIGPPDGSLTPEELSALAAFAKPRGVRVLGNQQSFAHMEHTLALPQYAHLRENPWTLSPVNEETYRLLDDLYADVLPRLEFGFFNVCCDETEGLGTGPSKELARQIGPGGVYVRHIRRVYDLVRGKYGKRMMMWGDIILQHPDKLDQIPKDVVMLTWGYDARDRFEDQILPFAKAGYEFFVCPGVNNWSRVLPDFRRAAVNIQNFVRDGVKHGASGMLNTSWDDDGENLNAPNWHGFAWGAECAWNASRTALADFNRRIGAVLFGELGEEFGQAIARLSDARLSGLSNQDFWGDDSSRVRLDPNPSAAELLTTVRQAISHLEACRRTSNTDQELLEVFLFGAQRLEAYFQRTLDRLAAARAYAQASKGKPEAAEATLHEVQAAFARTRDAYAGLRQRWQTLWLRENKPFALEASLRRYDEAIGRCGQRLEALTAARQAARAGQPLPAPASLGLALWVKPAALALPARIDTSLGHYQDYYPEFACDGDEQTFYWSDRGLQPGDHFTLRLESSAKFASAELLLGTDRYRQEYVHEGVLEVSADGNEWTKVADLNGVRAQIRLPGTPIRGLRLRALHPQVYWLIIREIRLQRAG